MRSMRNKKSVTYVLGAGALLCAMLLMVSPGGKTNARATLTPMEELGKQLFFDNRLSEPRGQACVDCHDQVAGWADPEQTLPVSEGAVKGRFGNRNSPSAAYAVFTPEFDLQKKLGGQFWDGRAANLVEQAKGPFLNPLEMNNDSRAMVVEKVEKAKYSGLFKEVFGDDAFNDVDTAFHNIAVAIAAFEGSAEVNPFTSKFDDYLAGLVELTPQEALGEKLFNGSAKCHQCHPARAGKGLPVLFTDFEYHNLGLPRNTEYPFSLLLPDIPLDPGLEGTTGNPADRGKFKTPHLRNIELTGPYMHHGLLKTLKDVVRFYNTRDVPGMWEPPEVPETMDGKSLGNLGLTDAEEDAIVAFMLTFTDR